MPWKNEGELYHLIRVPKATYKLAKQEAAKHLQTLTEYVDEAIMVRVDTVDKLY